MANFSIVPPVVIPAYQFIEDLPTAGTDNSQSGPWKSDFSKMLDDTVNSQQTRTEGAKASAKKETFVPDNSVEQRTAVSNEPRPTQQMEERKSGVSTAKDSEEASTQPESRQTVKSGQSQTEQADQDGKIADDDTKRDSDTTDTSMAAALMAQILADLQTPAAPTLTPSTPAQALLVEGVTATAAVTQDITVVPADSGNSQAVAGMPANLTQAAAAPVANNAIAQTEAATDFSTELNAAVQSRTDPATQNNTVMVNFSEQVPEETVVNLSQGENAGYKSAKTVDNGALKVETAVVSVNADDDLTKPVESSNGTADLNLTPATTGNDKSHPSVDAQGEQAGASSVANQTAGNGEKPPALNIPLIQTQFSVNNSTDKARTDIGIVTPVAQQQNQPVNTGVSTGAAANHVNRDDLFAQIVEKAKVVVNNGNSEMEVSLKPDYLGKLHLKVSVENQIVTAKFVAESQQVKEVIETNLNQLRRNLQESGIQVDQLMVSVGQQNNGSEFQQSSSFQNQFSRDNGAAFVHRENQAESLSDSLPEQRSLRETVVDYVA